MKATIDLHQSYFNTAERELCDYAGLKAYSFRFASGVCGLRLENSVGNVVLLPFQGQQIWSAKMRGRDLAMISVCSEPKAGVPFLETFGGFLQHCGMTAMGAPGAKDNHPLHGELPNAAFDTAALILGKDEKGEYIALTGSYKHSVVFGCNYVARPSVKVRQNSSIFDISIEVENLAKQPMDLMYMAHINFRTARNGRLYYTANATPESVRVRASIPSHISPKKDYVDLLESLKARPELHHSLSDELSADPEIVLCIDYHADDKGAAHSMQLHEDGSSDYVLHYPRQVPRATRWISRTGDHDALALVEPGTAEPEGKTREREKGNVMNLAGGAIFKADFSVGVLTEAESSQMKANIEEINRRLRA